MGRPCTECPRGAILSVWFILLTALSLSPLFPSPPPPPRRRLKSITKAASSLPASCVTRSTKPGIWRTWRASRLTLSRVWRPCEWRCVCVASPTHKGRLPGGTLSHEATIAFLADRRRCTPKRTARRPQGQPPRHWHNFACAQVSHGSGKDVSLRGPARDTPTTQRPPTSSPFLDVLSFPAAPKSRLGAHSWRRWKERGPARSRPPPQRTRSSSVIWDPRSPHRTRAACVTMSVCPALPPARGAVLLRPRLALPLHHPALGLLLSDAVSIHTEQAVAAAQQTRRRRRV